MSAALVSIPRPDGTTRLNPACLMLDQGHPCPWRIEPHPTRSGSFCLSRARDDLRPGCVQHLRDERCHVIAYSARQARAALAAEGSA